MKTRTADWRELSLFGESHPQFMQNALDGCALGFTRGSLGRGMRCVLHHGREIGRRTESGRMLLMAGAVHDPRKAEV